MNKFLLLVLLAVSNHLFATPAPDFDVTDSDGNQHALYADYISQGKVVVLEIFFVNCPPCATHAPLFQTLYQAKKSLHPGKVEFLLLTTMSNDHDYQVAQYKIAKNLTMPAVSSDGGSLLAISDYQSGAFGTFLGTPTFIVIAPNSGEVFFDIRGNSAQATMGKLSQLIDHLAIPAGPTSICGATTPTGAAVDNVRYSVDAPVWDTTITSGNYSLWDYPNLHITQPYNISAYKNDLPLAGVSTLDLVLLSKHILGITPFDADWKITAADVNLSGTTTTFDIVETRKLLLGIYDTFPFCTSWRFLPAVGTEVNGYCYSFQGIKMGDVNGSYSGLAPDGAEERTGKPIQIWAEDQLLEPGKTYRINFQSNDNASWQGLQASFGFDPETIEILGLESDALPGFGAADFNLNRQSDGILPLSWIGEGQSAEFKAGAPWLSLTLRAKQPGQLSEVLRLNSLPLHAEAYDLNDEKRPFELLWQMPAAEVFIAPNPASGEFTVEITAATAGYKLAQLFDNQGRLVFSENFFAGAGANRLIVRPEHATPGLYCLMLDGKTAGKVLLH